MALATRCPYCSTIFRVASDQLKLRGGIVRCGCCQQVFDGNAGLQDPAKAPQTTAPLPEPAPPVATPADDAPAAPALARLLISESIAAESFISASLLSKSPMGEARPSEPVASTPAVIPPMPADADPAPPPAFAPPDMPQPDAAPLPPKRSDLDPDFDLDFDFDLDAEPTAPQPASTPAPEHHWIDLDALTAADGARLQREAMLAEQLAAAPASPPQASDAESAAESTSESAAEAEDEPAFVVQGRRNQRQGKTVGLLLGLGSFALLLALLAQGVMTFGSQLAAQAPALKPALTTLCSALGCRIALPMQIKSISIELGELQTLSASAFSYATVLHNNSSSVQAWPNIELILSDGADKALLRRVFVPRDYLGPEQKQDISEGFAARSEQAVKLYFELDRINASGYHIAVFYP
jgi:predicted Zn finger-like uncharacterized protein